ncbi:MAG: isoprenylcysteine carboxylmethyltransferase family protein [Candidatus Thorarchaeota archaeon]
MSDDSSNQVENNYIPLLIALANFAVLLTMALEYMANTVELWDFIFILTGVYFSMKFVRLVKGAHEFPETRMNPKDRTSYPTEGIYAKIRHPIGAACIYMNLAYVCFTRSFALVPIVPVFIALWYIYAAHEEKILLKSFGDEYKEYMRATSMFRGSGFDQQRLASSGYDMY